jgi:hypothetical protein
MSFTVENGSGVTGANSYASLEYAADYHAMRGNTAWGAATGPAQGTALVIATDYIEATYRAHYRRMTASQGLQWPTDGIEGVPAPVKAATIILAAYALTGPLSAPAQRGVKSTTKKLAPLGEITTVYDDDSPGDPYPAITALLAPIANANLSNTITVGRLIR